MSSSLPNGVIIFAHDRSCGWGGYCVGYFTNQQALDAELAKDEHDDHWLLQCPEVYVVRANVVTRLEAFVSEGVCLSTWSIPQRQIDRLERKATRLQLQASERRLRLARAVAVNDLKHARKRKACELESRSESERDSDDEDEDEDGDVNDAEQQAALLETLTRVWAELGRAPVPQDSVPQDCIQQDVPDWVFLLIADHALVGLITIGHDQPIPRDEDIGVWCLKVMNKFACCENEKEYVQVLREF